MQDHYFAAISAAAETLGWTVHFIDRGKRDAFIYFETTSPLGEPLFIYDVRPSVDRVIERLRVEADEFDVEGHAAMYYDIRDMVSGIPKSLKALRKDASDIKAMLRSLSTAVCNAVSAAA